MGSVTSIHRGATILAVGFAIVVGLGGLAFGQSLEPSASIQVDSGSFLKSLGFQLVEATVNFDGRLYRVRLYNVSEGAQGYHATGQIYGLRDIKDIVGRYDSIAKGGAFVNDAGVEIVVNEPMKLSRSYLYIDYLGSLYARHDQSVQFGPRK
jgi:hypothetical protein